MRGAQLVQVQLRLPPPPLRDERREQRCCSASAQQTLCRFATGYVFGSASRLGAHGGCALHSRCPLHASPPRACCEASTQQQFARADERATNFAQRATNQANQPPLPQRRTAATAGKRAGTGGGSTDNRRRALIFGERAPKLQLPVKERIERRAVPKRSREPLSVDALTAMMENVLGTTPSAKRVKANGACKRLSEQVARLKVRASSSVATRGAGLEESLRDDGEQQKSGESAPSSTTAPSVDDDDTADELSFLVERCQLNVDGKQQPFMPYIT